MLVVNSIALDNSAAPGGRQGATGRSLGASLLFAAGSRPTAAAIEHLFESTEMAGTAARISHRPARSEGWLEVLASGLTFDLRGLAPADPAAHCASQHCYGFGDGVPGEPLEAVEIVPGGHIAAGGGLLPVIRTMAGLTANLALNLPVAAVAWHTAGTCVEPRYFARTVLNWLADGVFPALGLTALLPASEGSVASSGLAHFTGQEMQLAGAPGETQAETVKLAIRVVDYLVRNGKLTQAQEISGTGLSLLAEPSQFSNLVWVWRKE